MAVWVARLHAAMAIVALMWPGAQSADAQPREGLREIPEVAILRSRPERFVVVGTNRVWNVNLLRWVEEISDKVADIVGLDMSFDHRVLRIVVSHGPPSGDASLAVQQGVRNGMFVQELTIFDYEGVDVEVADVALCRLLLNGYVAYRWNRAPRPARASPATDPAAAATVPHVPGWLAQGVARNLYPVRRAANAGTLLQRWERGQAPMIRQFLEPGDDAAAAAIRDKAASGLLVDWLADRSDGPRVFDAIFARVAAGGDLSVEWLVEQLPDCLSPTDLEGSWDRWVLRQKRVVYLPGVVTARILKQFKEELVVHRWGTEPAVAPGGEALVRMELADMIGRRDADGMPSFARKKIVRLKILFMGRGDAMNRVVDAYCAFLSALADGKRERRLRALLKQAEARLAELELTTTPPAPANDP